MGQKILLVDDCLTTQALIRETLGPKYSVTGVTSPSAAYEQLGQHSFDLVLLDIDLPEQDGFEFCEKIKSDNSGVNLPVFFLSGKNTLDDKLMGFSLGADDYITKPFSVTELQARVDAKMRRLATIKSEVLDVTKGEFLISGAKQKIFANNQDLGLTSIEFRLLVVFINSEEQVMSREEILTQVWGANTHVSGRTVDSHIYSLRKKMGDLATYIKAAPGVGYRFSQKPRLTLVAS